MKITTSALAIVAVAIAAAPAAADDHWTADGGPYISGFITGQNVRASNATIAGNDQWEYDVGAGFIGSVGYAFLFPQYGVDLRAEIEGAYRRISVENIEFASGFYWEVNGETVFRSAMANIIIDVHTQSRFAPYFGGGMGRAELRFNSWVVTEYDPTGALVGTFQIPARNYDVAVWQAIAGVGYRLSPGLLIDLSYRYFQPNDRGFNGYISNEFAIGVRMTF